MSDPTQSNSPTKTIESVLARIGIKPNDEGEENLEKFFLLFILQGQRAVDKLVAEGKRPPGHDIGMSLEDLDSAIDHVLESDSLGDPIQLTINITTGGVGFAAIRAGELEQIRAIRARLGINDDGKAVGHGPH